MTWEMFKTTFLERFFPRDIREAKVEEFINYKKGSMTLRKYSLEFLRLSRYVTSLVSNSRDEMSRFLTGTNGDLDEAFRSAMLLDNMDPSRLMVNVQQVKDNSKKRGVHDARRPKPQNHAGSNHGGNKNNFCVREYPRFKKGKQSSGNYNSHKSTTPRGGRL